MQACLSELKQHCFSGVSWFHDEEGGVNVNTISYRKFKLMSGNMDVNLRVTCSDAFAFGVAKIV